jgi:ferritin-like metal-binding protein YciE
MAQLLKGRSLDPHEGKCRVIDSLLKKGQEILQSRGEDAVLDLGLVFIMRKIDLLEQSGYEDAKTVAEALGEDSVVKILEQHIREEGQHERSWVVLGEDMVDSLALKGAGRLSPISGAGSTAGRSDVYG